MKFKTWKSLFVIVALSCFIKSCSSDYIENSKSEKSYDFSFDELKTPQYFAILDSLKPNGYVPYFRMFQNTNFDFEFWKINGDEKQYVKDSIAYYKAREVFFNQDREFLNWLLSFKNDTIVDSNPKQRSLWTQFVNPYSSNAPICIRQVSRSKQAINLIYGFLDGSRIECIECGTCNNSSAIPIYECVETFLMEHENSSVEQLRTYWKPD